MTTTTDAPVYDREHIGRLYRANLSKGRATLGELFGGHIETGSEGSWIYTDDGRRFLNCGSYGVLITGARHPVVVRHVAEQLGRHPVASRVFLEPQAALAAEALVAKAPAGLERVHFACSGAEAVETAIKVARTRGKDQLIATHGGYHGKTMGALSLTGKDIFQEPFRPLLPGVHHVPYGDAEALEELLQTMPGRACFVVEPVQGEAGVVLPPPGYLRAVQELCRTYDAYFVLDEIQTGLGRLGTWWGADDEGVTPDVLLVGKALGGGILPVSAVVATPKAFAAFDKDPYLHTSTFSGTPMAMAAVRGALAAIEEDGLVERARDLGAEMLTTVREIARRHFGPVVREVRGRGLLIGIEFAIPGPAGDLLIELISHGVVANHSLNSHLVLRLTPPAVLDAADARFLYEAFDRACQAQAARYVPTFEGDSAHA
ncbi:ornithine aminotransferase [Streptomyces albus]|uniref:Ornithine aminotransferase n=1 Tax=Streptomyces albus (strain ATCC 21838 / DSM 41398 / FERM P-419 / JCM 4703 / NBRC 107858) TaxID=1081613 RepID=A0A0B5F4S1_STRA4|nr:ornithine aminotransferase [Streptomyces albus]AOU79619.1 ornithine aminotransferase [Streptomyces albus]AYN35342.1 aspartate aminotransferase family protein [Streptomyces albus]